MGSAASYDWQRPAKITRSAVGWLARPEPAEVRELNSAAAGRTTILFVVDADPVPGVSGVVRACAGVASVLRAGRDVGCPADPTRRHGQAMTTRTPADGGRPNSAGTEVVRGLASKVPAITALFWVAKALTTAMGESASDYLVHRLSPVAAVLGGFVAFCVALVIQLRVRRYLAWAYWFAVAMVGVFGTMAADVLHVGLGVPYAVSTALFVVTLATVFFTWNAVEGTLSIHSIYTRRRELFYWAAVVATFALGTAAGDAAAITLNLGYFASGLVFAALILIPAVGYWRFGMNPVLAFWFAYVLTRPLGASFADWLGKPRDVGGLGLGAGPVSLVLSGLIICVVAYLAVTKIDRPEVHPVADQAGEWTVVARRRGVRRRLGSDL